jgi:hypothetical protein
MSTRRGKVPAKPRADSAVRAPEKWRVRNSRCRTCSRKLKSEKRIRQRGCRRRISKPCAVHAGFVGAERFVRRAGLPACRFGEHPAPRRRSRPISWAPGRATRGKDAARTGSQGWLPYALMARRVGSSPDKIGMRPSGDQPAFLSCHRGAVVFIFQQSQQSIVALVSFVAAGAAASLSVWGGNATGLETLCVVLI